MAPKLKRFGWLTLVWALALPAAKSATANGPVSLTRSGKWNVDYAVDNCQLFGTFGEGSQQISLRFIRHQPGDDFTLQVIGKQSFAKDAVSDKTVDFGPEGNPRRAVALAGKMGDFNFIDLGAQRFDDFVYKDAAITPPNVTPEQEAAATTLLVRPLGGKAYRFELGSMRATMAALRKCNDDLVKFWGFDPAEQAALVQRPVPLTEPSTWLNSNDYPLAKALGGEMGIVNFRLDVDEQGNVASCHIQGRTKPIGFSDLTCRLIGKRAKFSPARNKAGLPVRSYYVNTVRWVISG